MESETSQKIDEIIFETNDKINAVVAEIRLIRFSKMDDKEKQEKYKILRREFEKIMLYEEKRIKQILDN